MDWHFSWSWALGISTFVRSKHSIRWDICGWATEDFMVSATSPFIEPCNIEKNNNVKVVVAGLVHGPGPGLD